jgi:hypothetical protein
MRCSRQSAHGTNPPINWNPHAAMIVTAPAKRTNAEAVAYVFRIGAFLQEAEDAEE